MSDKGQPALSKGTYSFGPFRLCLAERRLKRDRVAVEIGSRAFDILIALIEGSGEIVSNQTLIEKAWPNTFVDESNLRVHMVTLRKALGDDRKKVRYISNIPGRGYRFVMPASLLSAAPGISRDSRPFKSALAGRIIGRDSAIREVVARLLEKRFVTIAGPGGIGKTTVALAVAEELTPSFAGNIFFVDLGLLREPGLVIKTLGFTLGLTGQENVKAAVKSYLEARETIIIFDCCEHLVEEVASLVEELFVDIPGLRIVATSREALRAAGENVYQLAPLELPPPGSSLSAEEALQFPAIQLFVDRASASIFDFQMSDAEVAMVVDICNQLDGIALAIELAAGRVSTYGIDGILYLMQDRFRLLTNGRRTALPRHQTLQAAIDWSYDLLPEQDKVVLRRLSVFVAPFTFEAARVVVESDVDELDQDLVSIFADLIAKSLVTSDDPRKPQLYRLLDSTRHYMRGKLVESREMDQVAHRHARYYQDHLLDFEQLALESKARLDPAKMSADIANVRAALDWSFSGCGDSRLGSALAAVAAPLFLELSLVGECYSWTKRGLAALPDQPRDGSLEMKLLAGLGLSAMVAYSNTEEVQAVLRRGLDIAARLGAAYPVLRFLGPLHLLACRASDFRGSLAAAERCAEVADQIADPSVAVMANSMLASAYHILGNPKTSQRHCEAALRDAPSLSRMQRVYLGVDHRNRALCVSARNLWVLGYGDQALEAANFTIEETKVSEHPVTLGIAFWTVPVFIWAGKLPRAEAVLERLSILADKFSLQPYQAMVLGQQGGIAIQRGDPARGVLLLEEALRTAGTSYEMVTTGYLKDLADGLIALGRTSQALEVLGQASARVDANGELLHLPELLRLRGEALVQAGSADAERTLRAALDEARRQEASAWELRAAISVCRLLQTRGRADEGGELLSMRYACFREGFDTADLQAAAKLLGELGRAPTQDRITDGVDGSRSRHLGAKV
jgi:predicted ATPase/DNA-binding winged helix-turn-helix (wHTH) protein